MSGNDEMPESVKKKRALAEEKPLIFYDPDTDLIYTSINTNITVHSDIDFVGGMGVIITEEDGD